MKNIHATFKTEEGEEICKWDFTIESFMTASDKDKDWIWSKIREQFDAYLKQEVSL